jgi:hypothetical protein
MPPALFALVTFQIRSGIFAAAILLLTAKHIAWEHRHLTYLLRWGLTNFLPGLASNCYLPDLHS